MGAPSINISFIERAVSAITRGERGIVMLWVKDRLPETEKNPITVILESDIPKGLSKETVQQIKLAMMGYINAPKKVLIYCMGLEGETANTEIIEDEEEMTDAGYRKAMELLKRSDLIILRFRQ